MLETGSKPRGILEKSLNILDKSSTLDIIKPDKIRLKESKKSCLIFKYFVQHHLNNRIITQYLVISKQCMASRVIFFKQLGCIHRQQFMLNFLKGRKKESQ